MLFTKDQVVEILKSIDTDNTQSIDFFECLEVSMLLLFQMSCRDVVILSGPIPAKNSLGAKSQERVAIT